LQLGVCVTHCVAIRACGTRAEAVPGYDAFLRHGALVCFVHVDDEGQELSPGVVRHVLSIVERALSRRKHHIHLVVVERTDVVRLAMFYSALKDSMISVTYYLAGLMKRMTCWNLPEMLLRVGMTINMFRNLFPFSSISSPPRQGQPNYLQQSRPF
jgi:hypothetical protein